MFPFFNISFIISPIDRKQVEQTNKVYPLIWQRVCNSQRTYATFARLI